MDYKAWQNELVAEEIIEILNKKSYDARYAKDIDEAKKMVLDMIPNGASVALGGSETLSHMNLVEVFRNGDYNFFDRYQSIPFSETTEIYRQSMVADFLVTGVNAITRKGELVNTDSSGNRVAGVIFGPKRVIIVTGVNKVVDNLEEAFKRMRKIAPMNAKRNGHQTPCVISGRCEDCDTPQRLCNSIGIVNHGMKHEGRFTIIVIPQELGF